MTGGAKQVYFSAVGGAGEGNHLAQKTKKTTRIKHPIHAPEE